MGQGLCLPVPSGRLSPQPGGFHGPCGLLPLSTALRKCPFTSPQAVCHGWTRLGERAPARHTPTCAQSGGPSLSPEMPAPWESKTHLMPEPPGEKVQNTHRMRPRPGSTGLERRSAVFSRFSVSKGLSAKDPRDHMESGGLLPPLAGFPGEESHFQRKTLTDLEEASASGCKAAGKDWPAGGEGEGAASLLAFLTW